MACDDVSRAALDPGMVHTARKTEMEFCKGMVVYDRVPRSEQREKQSKSIIIKWIDVNQGYFESPNIRSRLVGKEFRTGLDDTLYASTPPLEALRPLISRVATVAEGEPSNEMIINDVSLAHFYAKCTRCLYVGLPKEDLETHPDNLGLLRLSLYVTRDATLILATDPGRTSCHL